MVSTPESTKPVARFSIGKLLSTPGALKHIPASEMLAALGRHIQGDWGVVCDEDRKANEDALKHEARLFSVYIASNETRFWIITEADRSATTVLLPEEY